MRGVSKPWPPADISPDGQTPRRLADAERALLAGLPAATNRAVFARSTFDGLEKSKLRAVLYREQRSLCVYCERRVQERYPFPPIDHWRPLSRNPELALHWKNLHLSCPSAETCDGAKGQRPLKWADADPDLPWPTNYAYETVLGFTSGGEIFVRADAILDSAMRRGLELAIDDQADGSSIRKAILNLNHPALVAARKAAIDAERARMEREFKGKTATREAREARAEALLARNPFESFVSVRTCWIRKELGKGRCEPLTAKGHPPRQ